MYVDIAVEVRVAVLETFVFKPLKMATTQVKGVFKNKVFKIDSPQNV